MTSVAANFFHRFSVSRFGAHQLGPTSEKGEHRVWSDVVASEFQGRKLPEVVINGTTLFRLFIARKSKKGGRDGRVLMGTARDDSRIPLHLMLRSTERLLAEEVVTALSSGVFEGEIIAKGVELHPNRQTFVKNDALIELCIAIEEWYQQHGADHFEEAKRGRREERYQALGLRSLEVLEKILRLPNHTHLLEVIKSFGHGTVGSGHTKLPRRQTGKEQENTSLSLDGNPGSPRTKTGEEGGRERQEPTKEKGDHLPLTVAGPKGSRRRVVSRSSFGLQLAHEPLEGIELWKLDPEEGILTFNTRHPSWVACEEKNDTAVMRLQEQVAMQALTLQAMPEGGRLIQRQVLDSLTETLVPWILTGDKLRGTVPSRPKKTAK